MENWYCIFLLLVLLCNQTIPRVVACTVECTACCSCPCKMEHLRKTPVLLISLDGMSPLYISGRFANTPYLDYLARTGVKSEFMYNVFPTSTWPNHHSMMTGLYPETHGIIANDFWDPEFNETFYHGPHSSNYNPKFWNQSEPLWLTVQNQGSLTGSYFWPGTYSYKESPNYYEPLQCCKNCTFNKWFKASPNETFCQPNFEEPFRNRIDKIINWLKSTYPPIFIAAHFEIPDNEGHKFGPHSMEYKEAIELADREIIGYLINSLNMAQLLDKVNLITVSDHGFAETRSTKQIFLSDYIDSKMYRGVKDNVMAQIWPNVGKEDEIFYNLTINKNPYMQVYKKEQIPKCLHWKNNRRIPPVLVIAELGWVLRAEPSPGDWIEGTHGYSNQYSEMWPMFFARGPDFREGHNATPFNNTDLYPLMCHLLGVEGHPNNGSLDNVKSILKEFSSNPYCKCK